MVGLLPTAGGGHRGCFTFGTATVSLFTFGTFWDPPHPLLHTGIFPRSWANTDFFGPAGLGASQRWILGSPSLPNTQLILDEIFTFGTNQQIRWHCGLFVSPGLLCASHLGLIGPSGQFAAFTFWTALVSSFTFGTFWDPPPPPPYWDIGELTRSLVQCHSFSIPYGGGLLVNHLRQQKIGNGRG